MRKNYYLILGMFFLVLIVFSNFVLAVEVNEKESSTFGIGLDELIVFGSSLLAIFLFVITFMAYKRDKRKRLLYVAIAFFLFAVKGILTSIDVFFPNKGNWADPLANFLDFTILLSFFFGLLKKEG